MKLGKILRCKDVGMDCGFEILGESEEEIMQIAAKHLEEVHGMNEIPNELVHKVRDAILDK